MSNETRIGIAAGLLIVVIASVYFFYGNRPEADDLLVTVPTRVAPDATAAPTQQPAPNAGRPVARAPVRPTSRSPVALNRFDRPAARPGASTDAPQTPRPVDAPVTVAQDSPASNAPGAATALRTSASPELLEATWDNLTKTPTGDAATPPESPALESRATTSPPVGRPAARGAQPNAARPQPPVAAPPAAPAWPGKHVIQKSDTLEAIATRYYGDGSKARIIMAANPSLKDPRLLRIGDALVIPEPKSESADTTARAPQPAQRTYVVQSGDTLFSIAQEVYGQGPRWRELFAANKTILKGNPQKLRPGMVLVVP